MSKFKTFLNRKLNTSNISQNQFAKLIGVTPTYVGQLIKGIKPPPDRELQIIIAENLNLNKAEREKYFDNIAKEKKDIPSDIYKTILENEERWNEIRELIKKEIEK